MSNASAGVMVRVAGGEVDALRAEYARCLRISERAPEVFRARVESLMAREGRTGPMGYAHCARALMLVHLACDGRGCTRCEGRGWHAGWKPLV